MTIKQKINRLVENIDDDRILEEVYEMIKRHSHNEEIVAYTTDGRALTKEQYIEHILSASDRAIKGNYINHDDLKKEAKDW